LSRSARGDLDEIFNYIARNDDVSSAAKFLAKLAGHLERIAATGHGGVPRNTIRPGLRLAVHGRYNIYFEIVEDQTIIVRALHSGRDIRRMGFNEEG
jgi:toxin ParE1/3/4